MQRPQWELADVINVAGQLFLDRNRHWLTRQHLKVLRAIQLCRTAALGGHVDECLHCGYRATSFNSCRNRHCPKCQSQARKHWLDARQQELLPTRYVHVVFTVPRELASLALQNKKLFYDLLFRASTETLQTVAADPKHLGAEIGFFSVLHTWTQKLEYHPHVHCVVPAGGLSFDHTRWVSPRYSFFLPVKVLSRVFRAKFIAGLKRAFSEHRLGFHGKLKLLGSPQTFSAFLRTLFRQDWVVYCKPPFGGPEHVLKYLGGYTHRIAISNRRLISLDQDQVAFRWRDSAHGNQQRILTLSVTEFLRRFLLHVLPHGFVRIRHHGFLANRRRATMLPLCFALLAGASVVAPTATRAPAPPGSWTCPRCGCPMAVVERLTPAQLFLRSPPQPTA